MPTDFTKIEADLRTCLEALRSQLPTVTVSFVEDLLNAGEYGIALEELCAAISSQKIRIPSQELRRLVRSGVMMEMDPSLWGGLEAEQE